MTERWQQYEKVKTLVPNRANAKTHDTALIQSSIEQLGFIGAVTVDERDGTLVEGHGRTEVLVAAQEAGLDPPAGVVVDDEGDWTVPVNHGWASKDAAEQKAATVVLNRAVERGGWNTDLLADLLTDLSSSPLSLDSVGYTGDDLNVLLALTGKRGDSEGGFLDSLAGNAPTHLAGHEAPIGVEDAVTLVITFATREERETVSRWLRELAKPDNLTMGAALLQLAEKAAAEA